MEQVVFVLLFWKSNQTFVIANLMTEWGGPPGGVACAQAFPSCSYSSSVSISIGLSLLVDQSAVTWWRGRPTMEGKTALGASSPANPALHRPDPLSQTRAVLSSSSHMTAGGAVGERRHYDTESHWERDRERGWLLIIDKQRRHDDTVMTSCVPVLYII